MPTRTVLFDALGTLVELEPPWPHLAAELGIEADERLVGALRAEMAYYKEHAHEGRDEASLADLRRRCAELVSERLGREVGVETLLAAIRFRAFPDAAPALAELRGRGLRLVCVSNWDVSLPEVLDRVGLTELLDGVVSSAAAGARKPDPAIFARALELAGCAPEKALHVGDTPAEDGAGARAAGIPYLIIARDGGGEVGAHGGVEIASLAEIVDHLRP